MTRKFNKLDKHGCAYNNAIRICQRWIEEGAIVYDCETSTWPPEGEILQLTCADLSTSEIVFSSYFKPKGKISEGAEKVHGISLKMVENEPVFAEKATEIERLFKRYKNRIAYNSPFDGQMLDLEWRRLGLQFSFDLTNTDSCAMHRSAEIYQEWNDYRNSYKWKKLAEMGEFLKLEWQGIAHDASADVLMTIDVIHAIAELPFRTA